jgi:N-formylglutamate amidohydrolase
MVLLVFWLAMFNFSYANAAAQYESAPVDGLVTAGIGNLPIILSAPHGGRQAVPGAPVRRGIGVPWFTIQRDNNTAELTHLIALKLSERLGAKPFVIEADFERKYIDANRAAEHAYESAGAKFFYDAYHRALAEAAEQVRRQWGYGFLIDIHGQGAEPDTIFCGTDNRKSVAAILERHGSGALSGPKSLMGQLHAKSYRILPNPNGQERERRYTGGYTTRTYGRHRGTKIDAMLLEFGTNQLRKADLERTAADLAQAIQIFAKEYLPLAEAGSRQPASP